MAVSLIGISRLEVENSFINYFSPSTEIYQGMRWIDDHQSTAIATGPMTCQQGQRGATPSGEGQPLDQGSPAQPPLGQHAVECRTTCAHAQGRIFFGR